MGRYTLVCVEQKDECTSSLGAIFYCISGDPTIVYLIEIGFIQQLDTALYREEIRKRPIDQSNAKAKGDYQSLFGVRK